MRADTTRVQDNEPVPTTKLRNIRVDEDLWAEAKRIADERRENLSAVLRAALVDYVLRNGGVLKRGEQR